MAAGTALYGRMKRVDTQGDLFLEVTQVVNKTYNINQLKAGAVSFEGAAKNTGAITFYDAQSIEIIRAVIIKGRAAAQRGGSC